MGQPLKTATISFLRQPLQPDLPPQYLEASVQVNDEWRLGNGPSANNYTHTWAWDSRRTQTQTYPEDETKLSRSSGLQWVTTESEFWGGIAKLLSTFDPDVILTSYNECFLGPSLLEAAARVRPWINGWGRFPGTPAPTLAQLGQ